MSPSFLVKIALLNVDISPIQGHLHHLSLAVAADP